MNQNQTILKHLKSGKKITSWEAITKYKITRLSARIYDLIDSGNKIKSKIVTEKGKRYAEYWI